MNILGINPFHNGSVCVLSKGKVVEYIEEERLTKKKYDELPFKSILYVLKKYNIDYVAIAGLNSQKTFTSYFKEEIISSFFQKLNFPKDKISYFDNHHHKTHSSVAFYNSGFQEAISIIIDAGGSHIPLDNTKVESDTIFVCSYPNSFKPLYQNLIDIQIPPQFNPLNIGQSFERLCNHFGFKPLEGGKIMGLSSYGNFNKSIPNLFYSNNTNYHHINRKKKYKDFFPDKYNNEWHHDKTKITDLEKDLSWKLQTESQIIIGNYVESAIKETRLNNVVVAGGYGLNCVSNYYLKKRFPNINFYFEPLSHDGGTSIGAAKLLWHQKTQDTTVRPQKTLYYGPKYSKEELLKGIKKYVDTPQ